MGDLNQIEMLYRNELEDRKQNIRKSMGTVAGELVKIGFELKKIRDGNLYIYDNCKNIYEFAEKEFHMDRTAASKMMKLNDTYSADGYSEQIKEHLEEKLNSLGKTLLIEMMYLPEEDYDLITPDTKVTDIRELKNAETQKEEETQLPGQMNLLNSMPEVVPESEKPQKEEITTPDVIRELFRPREMKEYLDTLVNMDPDSQSMEWWVSDFNQSNNRTYNKNSIFLWFYSLTDGMKIKNIKTGSIETKTYKDFYFMVRAAFAKETASGTDVWNQAFGKEYEAELQRRKEDKERKEKKEKKEIQREDGKKQGEVKENQEKIQSEETEKPILETIEEENGVELKKINENSNSDNNIGKTETKDTEIVTGEVENITDKDKNEVCDIAQTTDSFNMTDISEGYTVTLPATINQRMYKVYEPTQESKAFIGYIYPYLYEVRGEKNIKMYYRNEIDEAYDINVSMLKEMKIYTDLQEAEKEEMRLNGKEKENKSNGL